jgi:hypothetical protein
MSLDPNKKPSSPPRSSLKVAHSHVQAQDPAVFVEKLETIIAAFQNNGLEGADSSSPQIVEVERKTNFLQSPAWRSLHVGIGAINHDGKVHEMVDVNVEDFGGGKHASKPVLNLNPVLKALDPVLNPPDIRPGNAISQDVNSLNSLIKEMNNVVSQTQVDIPAFSVPQKLPPPLRSLEDANRAIAGGLQAQGIHIDSIETVPAADRYDNPRILIHAGKTVSQIDFSPSELGDGGKVSGIRSGIYNLDKGDKLSAGDVSTLNKVHDAVSKMIADGQIDVTRAAAAPAAANEALGHSVPASASSSSPPPVRPLYPSSGP